MPVGEFKSGNAAGIDNAAQTVAGMHEHGVGVDHIVAARHVAQEIGDERWDFQLPGTVKILPAGRTNA